MIKELHRKPFQLVVCLIALLLAGFAPAGSTLTAATFYINPDYTGTIQNGSQENPFKSWNSVVWNNGNTYLQKAGTTCTISGSLTITSKNGITLGSYDTGAKPKIISTGGTSTKVIDITSCFGMTITGLEIASASGQVTAGILIDGNGSANNLIEQCIVRDVQWGIRILTTSAGNRILNCEVFNTQDDGIYIKDTPDIEIGYCLIYRVNLKYFVNPDQSYSAGDNIQIASTNNHNFNIHHNTLDHSYTGNKFCFIAWGNNYTGVLEHNVFIGNRNQTTSCLYLSPTTGSVTMRYNSIREGNYGVYAYVSNFNVYYNELIGNKIALCILNNYHLLAENNIFYNNVNTAISGLSNSSVTSKNNIFYTSATAKAYSTNGTLSSDYNVYNKEFSGFINGHATLNSWRSSSGQDSHSFVADPLFISPSDNNFMLQPQSPCINNGTSCGYAQDFFGTTVPQGPSSDIGYFEYQVVITNDPPVISDQQFSIEENISQGSIVGQVSASDPDGDAITYQITGGNGQSVFSVNQTTGIIIVTDSAAADFETNQSFQIQITVSDSQSATATATISIDISDVNEKPEMEDQGFVVPENIITGTVIGQLNAYDPDSYQVLSYYITSGNEQDAFVLDPVSGVLSVGNAEVFDFELNQQFPITVSVSDNSTPVMQCESQVTVTITDLNEEPSVTAGQYYEVNFNAPAGTLIGYIQATDPDLNQYLTYEITGGNIYNAFAIDHLSGALTTTGNALVHHANKTVNLEITVFDNGDPQYSDIGTAQVKVNRKFVNAKTIVENSVLSHVYPNPSEDGRFNLMCKSTGIPFKGLVRVTNLTGEIILEEMLAERSYYEINLSGMPNGVYVLEIISGENKEIKKLIIQ